MIFDKAKLHIKYLKHKLSKDKFNDKKLDIIFKLFDVKIK